MPAKLQQQSQDKPKQAHDVSESEAATVRRWTSRVKASKRRWQDDFDRMRKNREFDYGFQWQDQEKLDDDRVIVNIVLAAVNQRVATLYAKNPKAVFQRRPRLDFELWDGDPMSIRNAMASWAAFRMGMTPAPDMHALALLQDFNNGIMRQHQVKKVGETLEVLYQWMVDEQEPDFKECLKALVRRVAICGVGYIKLGFVRAPLTTPEVPLTTTDFALRAKRVKDLMSKLQDGDFDDDSPKMEELKSNMMSLVYDQQVGTLQDVSEKLILSYPKASSIIPDKDCTCLKDFVGANFIAEERVLPLSFVNEYYEVKIEATSEVVTYSDKGNEFSPKDVLDGAGNQEAPEKKLVCLWEITDKTSKTRFTICNGWKGYVVPPEPVHPCTHRFWPIIAITFNDTEFEHGDKGSIFPPSDVQLMKSAQKEYNRTRQSFRDHRKANAPRQVAKAGSLNNREKEALRECEPHSVVDVNFEEGKSINDVIQAVPTVPIDPQMYATQHLERDVEAVVNMQQANIGPAQPNVTATVGSIAEQSRMTKSSSNIDDLDGLLSKLARAAGEVLLKEMSIQTVRRIVGPGALWPDPVNRMDFANEIVLDVKAASSGRPNKGVEMANLREMMPLLLQAGANPVFLVREMIKRWDDNLDPTEAFPLVPQMPGPVGGPPAPQGPGQGQRPQAPNGPPRPGVDNNRSQNPR